MRDAEELDRDAALLDALDALVALEVSELCVARLAKLIVDEVAAVDVEAVEAVDKPRAVLSDVLELVPTELPTVDAIVPSASAPVPHGMAEPSGCSLFAGGVTCRATGSDEGQPGAARCFQLTAPVLDAIVKRVVHCGSASS